MIGALAALLGSFGATFFAQWLAQRQDTEKKYNEKIEEMQELLIQVKLWAEVENNWQWLNDEFGPSSKEKNTLDCPIDRLSLLVNRYEPRLVESVSQMKKAISDIKFLPIYTIEQRIDDEEVFHVYREYYDSFLAADVAMNHIFEQLNKELNKKGVDKITTPR